MIFDSTKMIELREKYRRYPDYEVPEIVLLDRNEEYAYERQLLENLVGNVKPKKQKDWIHRLLCIKPQQHIGAWFEIMLYGWLKNNFQVSVEARLLENLPDFIINIDKTLVAIEARSFLISSSDRNYRARLIKIWNLLKEIKRPFLVQLDIRQLCESIDTDCFQRNVISWLDSTPDLEHEYIDENGNIFYLSAMPFPAHNTLALTSSEGIWSNPQVLKAPLEEKAKQHKALRGAGYPYVIAIFLEPDFLSAEEVVEAWLGNIVYKYDLNTHQIVNTGFDETGLHYIRKQIVHRSVTGTLVFKSKVDKSMKTRVLHANYVQNPYAKTFIDPFIFPVESRFTVVDKKNIYYEMRWSK